MNEISLKIKLNIFPKNLKFLNPLLNLKPINNILVMQMANRQNNLRSIDPGLFFLQSFSLREKLAQIPARTVLHHHE